MSSVPIFPTSTHRQAAQSAVDFYSSYSEVEAVLVTNSCARGVATSESDLDMAVLVSAEVLPTRRTELE